MGWRAMVVVAWTTAGACGAANKVIHAPGTRDEALAYECASPAPRGRGPAMYSYRNTEQTRAKQTVHARRTRQTRARSGPLRAAGRIKHSASSWCERARRLSLATVVCNGHANYEQRVGRRRAQGFWRRRPGWLCVEGVFCLAWPVGDKQAAHSAHKQLCSTPPVQQRQTTAAVPQGYCARRALGKTKRKESKENSARG